MQPVHTLVVVFTRRAAPVGSEGTEGRSLVAVAVHLSHRVRSAVLGQNLLVLDSGAFERLPQVYVLKRDYEAVTQRLNKEPVSVKE